VNPSYSPDRASAAGTPPGSLLAPAARSLAVAACRLCLTWIVTLAIAAAAPCASANDGFAEQLGALEGQVQGFPRRTVVELAMVLPRADSASPPLRRFAYGLYGQASVLAGDAPAAVELAERLEAEAAAAKDPATHALGLLIRSAIEASGGDSSKAIALARRARDLVTHAGDDYVKFSAALAVGTLARTLGQTDEALASLQDALAHAESADNAFRRSSAHYQIAVLHRVLMNAPESLAASLAAYQDAELARSAYAMTNAKIAESAVMELQGRPVQELAAMERALAIARRAHSEVAETRVLVNLADLRLRRSQFTEALELSRRALTLAQALGDPYLEATTKANMGFALFGLGRVAEGKRLTDEALADYERSGATAEIAELVSEYARSLERVGDYKGALAQYHREQQLLKEIALKARQVAVLEVQEKYESEKRRREIDLLNRENAIKTAEIAHHDFQQRLWWLLAAFFAFSFVVVVVLYRKLRESNELLARKNSELDVLSSHDPLTELYNRRYFQAFADAEESRTERRRPRGSNGVRALMLVDIDHFKETNDRFGHAVGDAVLVAIAHRMRSTLRETDMIVRWGGEEFLIVAEVAEDRIDEIAARLLHIVAAEPIVVGDKAIRATVSVGYVPMPVPPSEVALSWDRAIGLVDMALYMAKVQGRNRAYGLRRFLREGPEALAAAERDLQRAWSDGLVDMHVIYGPWPANAPQAEIERVQASPAAAPDPARRVAAC
jgi:diguanylate cyclase (GGDEF)-like protein